MGSGASATKVKTEALEAFKALEKDVDGRMSKDEIKTFLQSQDVETFTDEACDEMLKLVDKEEEDGSISTKEFSAWLEKMVTNTACTRRWHGTVLASHGPDSVLMLLDCGYEDCRGRGVEQNVCLYLCKPGVVNYTISNSIDDPPLESFEMEVMDVAAFDIARKILGCPGGAPVIVDNMAVYQKDIGLIADNMSCEEAKTADIGKEWATWAQREEPRKPFEYIFAESRNVVLTASQAGRTEHWQLYLDDHFLVNAEPLKS